MMLRWTGLTSGKSGWRTRVPVRMRRLREDTPLCSWSSPVESGPVGVSQNIQPLHPCIQRTIEFCSACERRESVLVGALGAGRPGWTGAGDDGGDDDGDDDGGVVWQFCGPGVPTGPPGCVPWEECVRVSGSAVGGSSPRYSGY